MFEFTDNLRDGRTAAPEITDGKISFAPVSSLSGTGNSEFGVEVERRSPRAIIAVTPSFHKETLDEGAFGLGFPLYFPV